MNIAIEEVDTGAYVYVDGWFHCRHDNVWINENGVYCPDCQNKDLTLEQAIKLQEEKEYDLSLGFDETPEYGR